MIDRHYKNGRRIFSITPSVLVVAIFFALGLFISYFVIIGYLSAKHHSSYIPEISMGPGFKSSETLGTMELSNQWYKLKATNSGNIRVENMKGEEILTNFTYFYEYENGQNGNHLKNVSVNILNDSVMAIKGFVYDDVIMSILLTVCGNRPKMNVTVKTSYLSDRTVIREALIAEFKSPVSEVYLKNCDIDIKSLSGEYWVDKQGVRFGKGSTSALIYHTPGVSSIQLNSRRNLLFVNLDYSLDHPFIKFPFQADGAGKWFDISASHYKAGDERINTFALHFGSVPEVLPRLMLVPGGYLAGYIFTEHADGGNLRTHRAAYFGSENIKNFKDAIGGFSGHQIPVTKSVFFDEFDDGLGIDSCLKEGEYLNFLDQLHTLGNDLCLHTPEDGNSTRNTMREAIMLMNKRYDSRSWIDHGMFHGNNNREALSADGLDSASQYYAGDLWKEFNIRYFWSPAVEALRFINTRPSLDQSLLALKFQTLFTEFWRRYNFLRLYTGRNAFEAFGRILHGYFPMLELNSQRPFMGHSFPTPLYWQNPTYSGQFYSWPTEFDYNGVTRHLDSTNVGIELRHLDLLIEKRGVFFNHGYYVRNHEHDEILTLHEGELIINPYFDSVLAYMDQKSDEGGLLLTTVRDLLDYRLQVENIVLDYKPDGTIDVLNNNHQEVKGLSLAVRCNPESVILKGAEYHYKQVHEDTIIWFNLPAETSVNLTFDHQ
jgi:hypothetical protein